MKQKNKWRFLVIFLALAIPLLLTTDAKAWQGDTFCLQCHKTGGVVALDKESYLKTGHKNMLREVCPNNVCTPLAGPDGVIYLTDASLNPINWATGTVNIGGVDKILYYILDGWFVENTLPSAIYGSANPADPPGPNYSCAKCHTTGYEADNNQTPQPAAHITNRTGTGFSTTVGGVVTSWNLDGIQCERCHGGMNPPFAGHPILGSLTCTDCHDGTNPLEHDGWYTPTHPENMASTELCMNCHSQNALPPGGSGWSTPQPKPLVVGAHGSYAEDFSGHPIGDEYLNSPKARFQGTSAELTVSSKYHSHFWTSGKNRGCVGCHDVHESTVDVIEASPIPADKECTDCHGYKKVADIRHPSGEETPIEDPTVQSMDPCVVCHMPKLHHGEGLRTHLYRINIDPAYRTFPTPMEFYGGVCNDTHDGKGGGPDGDCDDYIDTNGNKKWDVGEPIENNKAAGKTTAYTASDGELEEAVWLDLDSACGQCHGGGTDKAETTGSIDAKSMTLTVADATGFIAGEVIEVEGAGTSDLEAVIVSISENSIKIVPGAATTVTDAHVIQNPPKKGMPYMSKAYLASWAVNIHQTPEGRFNWMHGTDCYQVNFDATMNRGATDTVTKFAWNFGDLKTWSKPADNDANTNCNDKGTICSHTYAAPGTYAVTLTVNYSLSRIMLVTAKGNSAVPDSFFDVFTNYDGACTDGNPCTDDPTGMTARVKDGSAPNSCGATTAGTAYVMWGDGTTTQEGITLGDAEWDHEYNNPGTYHITYCVKDSNGNKSCAPKVTVNVPDKPTAVYEVSGLITYDADTPCYDLNGDGDCTDLGEVGPGNGAANVTLYLKNGLTIVKMGKTDTSGNYEINNVPVLDTDGDGVEDPYTIVPKRNGYFFTPETQEVDSSSPMADFEATSE